MTEKLKQGRPGILSVIIDPLLFAGGKRVCQIANEVVAHFGNKYEKKRVVNNIRARITFFTKRRGYRFEKNSLRQVQLVKEVPQLIGVDLAEGADVAIVSIVPVTENK